MYNSIEICAGAGGQALGLEQAGFNHLLLVEYEQDYCDCLKCNRPQWNVLCRDVRAFDGCPYMGRVDLLSGGVPCPPFSVAGKQLGKDDDRDLFPQMLRLVEEIFPKVVMIENVKGLLSHSFDEYRSSILRKLSEIGYKTYLRLINASDFGVPQLRPRVIIIGVRRDVRGIFKFPEVLSDNVITVGEALGELMSENGWIGVGEWKRHANKVAPTIVGGSKKHGGPDLGPSRARATWETIGVDGKGVANEAPSRDFKGLPRLTPRMLARLQGFPDDWNFGKKKTTACRMIGNAFPPPVAYQIGLEIKKTLDYERINIQSKKSLSQRAFV